MNKQISGELKMDQDKALRILNKNTSMPDDEELTKDAVNEYRAAIDYLDDNQSGIVFLKPLIHSLGAYDGWRVRRSVDSFVWPRYH